MGDDWGNIPDDWQVEAPKETNEEQRTHRRRSECLIRTDANIYRTAFSETQLLDIVGLDFKDGQSYHVITAGDVDSLSFLKVVLRQQSLDYCLLSTWCMAGDDILQFGEWLDSGKIKIGRAHV
jgi:hypothetical protein